MVRRTNPQLLAAGVAVFVVAFAIRVILPWSDGALRYQMHTDDGVYYSATIALWHGSMPYTDFVFLHPPGILVLLTPFVAIGSLFGDSTGLFLAREAWSALGSLNAVLVLVLLWRQGRIAAIGAGAFYATWGVVAVVEVPVNLVTALNTMFLLAALILQRWPKRILPAGALIGFACATSIWASLYVVVFVPYVWVSFGRAAALRFLAFAATTCAVVCAPFAFADPGRAWTRVITDQLGRPSEVPSFKAVLNTFVGVGTDGNSTLGAILVVLAFAALALPLIVALGARKHPREWGDAPWLSVLIALQMVMLLKAPVFYNHYAAFVGPQVALMWGGLIVLTMRHHRAATLAAVPVVTGAAIITLNSPYFSPLAHKEIVEATSGYRCVWALDATTLVNADVMSKNLANGCDLEIDGFGAHLILKDPAEHEAWQRHLQKQLEGSDAIVMGVLEYWYLDEINRDYIRANFHNDVQVDPGGVDVRERYGVERSRE